jgi:hypothetical protein
MIYIYQGKRSITPKVMEDEKGSYVIYQAQVNSRDVIISGR